MATLIALIMVGMLTLIGLAALSTSDDEMSIAGNELQEMRAFYGAEAGLEAAAAAIQAQYTATGLPPTTLPSGTYDINNCHVVYRTVDNGAPAHQVLSYGTMVGLHAMVKSFTVTADATSTVEPARIRLTQAFEAAFIPIYQFAVFYNRDLEIAPGPLMSLIGRVHSNGNLYIQSGNTLNMDSYVTAAGDILHGRKGPGTVDKGDILIKDPLGNYENMKTGGSTWLDASDPNWFDASTARWGGRVQDAGHGQQKLAVPLSSSSDPHALIEPAGGGNIDSYENKASLKCIDGTWYKDMGGVWQDITANMIAAGAISGASDKFYDSRENVGVDVVDLDMQKLYASGLAPTNGVIYYSQKILGGTANDYPALRLVNGDSLWAPLTLASANPVYTLGDFNSDVKKPAAILADALTFLSANFDDNKTNPAFGWTQSDRPATATTVNVSYVAGNVETDSTNYNGGFENLARFLEDWGGVAMNWKGSAVCLWNSVQADGIWNQTYYTAPNRNWLYDTDLDDPANMPPGTPLVRVFIRSGWRQEHVGYESTS
jgi:hypothetical protein